MDCIQEAKHLKATKVSESVSQRVTDKAVSRSAPDHVWADKKCLDGTGNLLDLSHNYDFCTILDLWLLVGRLETPPPPGARTKLRQATSQTELEMSEYSPLLGLSLDISN
jgi:hypothetical protein